MAPAAKKKKAVDVRSPSDVKTLQEVLKAHPITIILIHADWCGHCQRYKENVWNKLEGISGAKNGLAAIHHDQLENTEFADAKIRGYPSVILVGKKKMAEFEDEEGPTNAIPSEQANDLATMETIARSAEPSTLTGSLKNMTKNVDVEEPEQSVRKSSAKNSSVAVPDPTKDTLDTQLPAGSDTTEYSGASDQKKAVGGGGSLYESLLAAARATAPAAALVATALVLKKGGRKSRRKAVSSRRSGTKRRRSASRK